MNFGVRPLFPKLLFERKYLHHKNDRINNFSNSFNQPKFKIIAMRLNIDNNACNQKTNANYCISCTHDDSSFGITF